VYATGGEDKMISLYRVGRTADDGTSQALMTLQGNSSPVVSLQFSPSCEQILSASEGGSLKVFDLSSAKLCRQFSGHLASVTSLGYHPYGDFIASGSLDTNVKLWDVRHKRVIATYKGHSAPVSEVSFSPDGQWVASVSAQDGSLNVWDLVAGKQISTIQVSPCNSQSGPTSLLFNPNEFLTAVPCANGIVKIYDMETFQLLDATMHMDGNKIHDVVWCTASPDAAADAKTSEDDDEPPPTLLVANDAGLRNWSIDPRPACIAVEDVAWRGPDNRGMVADMVVNTSHQLVAGVIDNDKVSVWAVDVDSMKDRRDRMDRRPQPDLKRASPGRIPPSSSASKLPVLKTPVKSPPVKMPEKYRPPSALNVSGVAVTAAQAKQTPPTMPHQSSYVVETPDSNEAKPTRRQAPDRQNSHGSSSSSPLPPTSHYSPPAPSRYEAKANAPHEYDSSPEHVVMPSSYSRRPPSAGSTASDDDLTTDDSAIIASIAAVGIYNTSPSPSQPESADSTIDSSQRRLGHIYDFASAMGAVTPRETPEKAESKAVESKQTPDDSPGPRLADILPVSNFKGGFGSRSPTPVSPRRKVAKEVNDDGVIGQILLGRLGATSCLGDRLEKMNKLRSLWSAGDVLGCLSYCSALISEDSEDGTMEGAAVTSDFLRCINMKSSAVMKLAYAGELMKVLVKIILPEEDGENPNDATLGNSTIAIHGRPFAATSMEAAAEIISAFGALVFDTCGRAPGIGVGIDVERESRFDKCWGVHESFATLCDRFDGGSGAEDKREVGEGSAIRFAGLIDLKDKRARVAAEKLDSLLRKYKRGLL
jgi:WD40 repeat protein